MADFMKSFLAGGVSGAVAKTCTAPIERVKLIIQTQDANPKIISGEVPRYTGIGNVFSRVASEQGIGAFWRGNFVNIIRYFPTQAFNFAFKDSIKALFPKSKDNFGKFMINMASGGLAGAGSLTVSLFLLCTSPFSEIYCFLFSVQSGNRIQLFCVFLFSRPPLTFFLMPIADHLPSRLRPYPPRFRRGRRQEGV
jgi:solute carrier family 25 (adenine nucleotide translocator) protein 4/5/6/31